MLRLCRALPCALILLSPLAMAEETAPTCGDPGLSHELALLCMGLAGVDMTALVAEDDLSAYRPAAPRPSLARRPLSSRFNAWGVSGPPPASLPPRAEDRGLGLHLGASRMPLGLSTTMVQPGDPQADMRLGWEVKAESVLGPRSSGLVWGGALAGSSASTSRSFGGYAGLRRVMQPFDNLQVGAEFAPRITMADVSGLSASAVLEPKLTTRSTFGNVLRSGYDASFDVDLRYRMPLDADGSGYGGLRLIVRPR